MERFFFDIEDADGVQRDEVGTEYRDLAHLRTQVHRVLPDIVRDEIARHSDRQVFTIVVSDQTRKAIYSATLSYTGMWLERVQ